jgi:hypothetical protein
MRTAILVSTLSLSILAVVTTDPKPASACGGCFSPPDVVTTVDSHRMVISLSAGRTTLWDQIRYSGDPRDFVWVLPVPDPAATIDLAAPEFFTDLDAATAPAVQPASPPPQLFCPRDGDGFGCGSSDNALALSEPDAGGVTIFDQDTIGPYETVTIGAETPTALNDWLVANDYQIPPSTLPVLAYYIDQGSSFIALRLSPGQGVSAMQPVRVRYPGYMATFPLKMVTVGASGVLELALWVIADQRYDADGFANLTILGSDLTWDWSTQTSDYDVVFDRKIDEAGGRAWIVEYANLPQDYWFRPESQADWEVAQIGLSAYPTITRLRTRMLVDHLTDDLELVPATNPFPVGTQLFALHDANRPPDVDCDEGICATGLGRRDRGTIAGLVLFGVGVVALRRRRRAT